MSQEQLHQEGLVEPVDGETRRDPETGEVVSVEPETAEHAAESDKDPSPSAASRSIETDIGGFGDCYQCFDSSKAPSPSTSLPAYFDFKEFVTEHMPDMLEMYQKFVPQLAPEDTPEIAIHHMAMLDMMCSWQKILYMFQIMMKRGQTFQRDNLAQKAHSAMFGVAQQNCVMAHKLARWFEQPIQANRCGFPCFDSAYQFQNDRDINLNGQRIMIEACLSEHTEWPRIATLTLNEFWKKMENCEEGERPQSMEASITTCLKDVSVFQSTLMEGLKEFYTYSDEMIKSLCDKTPDQKTTDLMESLRSKQDIPELEALRPFLLLVFQNIEKDLRGVMDVLSKLAKGCLDHVKEAERYCASGLICKILLCFLF